MEAEKLIGTGSQHRRAAPGLLRGARDSASLLLGFIPLGMAFGISAREYGFSATEASLMSLIVYAGASQFIALALIASGAGLLEVAITTFFVNLRHALMSASLSVYLLDTGRGLLSLLAFHVTDETFGLSITRFRQGRADRWYLLGANVTCYAAWNVGTVSGHLAGEVLPAVLRSAMAFALPAVFISLLVMSCRDRIALAVAAFSCLLSVALYVGHVDFGNVVLVAVAASTLGMVMERWKAR